MEIFKLPNEFEVYFTNQLILSSTLLGALVATSVFLLQSGFSSFQFSRTMFLKYFVRLTKFMFLLLGYNIIISLIYLHLNSSEILAFILHCIFSLLFTKYFFDFYEHKGYIHTLFSSKSNTKKQRLSQYFKYIYNLGFIQVLVILLVIASFTLYPFLIGKFGFFSLQQGFISTTIAFVICVVSLIQILPQYFEFSEKEFKQKQNNELTNEIEVDISNELTILKSLLIKNGRSELETRKLLTNINGEIDVNLIKNKPEAFFVINLWVKSSNVQDIVRWIEEYSYDFFKELKDSNVDVNSFVFSFFIHINGVNKSKTYFIRAKRLELENLYKIKFNATDFIKAIENKLVDELFRNI